MSNILLIDDDMTFLEFTAEILRSAGYHVDTAATAKRGLALQRANPHDLIITDIIMADMDGLELIMQLRSEIPRPRIIAVSGGTKLSNPLYLPTAKRLGVQRALANRSSRKSSWKPWPPCWPNAHRRAVPRPGEVNGREP